MSNMNLPNNAPKLPYRGCYVATLTPLDDHDKLDEGVVRAHAQWLVEQGVEGLCPAGTTGEFLYLSEDEKKRVVKATVEAVNGKVPVIAGIWALREAELLSLAKAARDSGADAVFLPPPIYYPANEQTIQTWYIFARHASKLPVFAYNIPQYAANEISLATLELLFSTGNIAGVKDSSGKTERMQELVTRFGGQNVVFAASDGFASESRKIGADGFISAIANVAPTLFAKLWQGDDSLQPVVNEIRSALKQMGSIPALHYLAIKQGFAFYKSRLPLNRLDQEQQNTLDALYDRVLA